MGKYDIVFRCRNMDEMNFVNDLIDRAETPAYAIRSGNKYQCSECQSTMNTVYPFCPYCGRPLRKEEDGIR